MNADALILGKAEMRKRLAREPFVNKISILIRMQRMARAMAQSSGRTFRGCVWDEHCQIM